MKTTYLPVNTFWLQQLDALHERCHDVPRDFEDVVMTALTRRDYSMLLLGMDCLLQFHPCLEPDLEDLLMRFIELRKEQKPDWLPVGREG